MININFNLLSSILFWIVPTLLRIEAVLFGLLGGGVEHMLDVLRLLEDLPAVLVVEPLGEAARITNLVTAQSFRPNDWFKMFLLL